MVDLSKATPRPWAQYGWVALAREPGGKPEPVIGPRTGKIVEEARANWALAVRAVDAMPAAIEALQAAEAFIVDGGMADDGPGGAIVFQVRAALAALKGA